MCFGGGGGSQPPHNPAPYALDQSHTAVEYEQAPAPAVAPKKTATTKKADTPQTTTPGLNVGGM